MLLPTLAGVVAIPRLVHSLGVDRFGLLSLAWIIVGYFSLFDMGMGRALTKLIADKLGANEERSIPPLVWTSLLLLLLLGVTAAAVLLSISPWLLHHVLKIPSALQPETLRSFEWLAASIPIVTVTSGLRGVLEAQQRFRILNLIRMPMSIFLFLGPLLVLPFSHRLVPVIGVLVAGRLAGGAAHLIACLYAMPRLRHNVAFQSSVISLVIKFGGWMNVSNLLAPIMGYLDRFLIGALVSVGALAYYTAPFEIVSRLAMVPGAVSGVLFPAFALSLVRDPTRTKVLLSRGVKYIFLAVFPVVLVISAFAPEALRLWLGVSFAQNSSSVLRWLAVGVVANCLAQLPFALLQSAGRPDIPTKLQLVELPVYVFCLLLAVKAYGIKGAAIVCAGRFLMEAVFLFTLAHRLLPHKAGFLPKLSVAAAVAFLSLLVTAFPQSLAVRIGLVVLILLVFALASWFVVLEPEERTFILRSSPKAG